MFDWLKKLSGGRAFENIYLNHHPIARHHCQRLVWGVVSTPVAADVRRLTSPAEQKSDPPQRPPRWCAPGGRKLRGDAAEEARVGGALPQRPVKVAADGESGDADENAGPPLLLAESWDNSTDLSDWWMSEKLDGVRAYWDGRQFLSRQGNLYHAPAWFIEGLPELPLDGELWIDRKKFQPSTQLSYTFRPRRRPKPLRDKREKCHHSLKALAIREKKIHIVGSPELKLEGTPV